MKRKCETYRKNQSSHVYKLIREDDESIIRNLQGVEELEVPQGVGQHAERILV